MQVIKSNSLAEPFQISKLEKILQKASEGLSVDIEGILTDVEVGIYDGVNTKELHELVIQSCLQLIQQDPDYSRLAARVLLFDIYKQALGKQAFEDLESWHMDLFPNYIIDAIDKELLNPKLKSEFDLDKLSVALEHSRDLEFRYNGLYALQDRYLVKDLDTEQILETPQFFWMRVAMGVSLNESDPTEAAIRFYDAMSQMKYIPSTPTLFNAGTNHSQLSSCFLLDTPDNMDGIGATLVDIMQLSKYAGGIGGSVTKLRATGSVLKKLQGKSSGPIPFIKMMDAVISGVDQGGKRRGTMAVYMEPWHYDIERFIDLKRRDGDHEQRVHTLNTVLFLNDEFMERVEEDQPWYLFDPNEAKDLTECYGQEFSMKYNKYIQDARDGKIKMFRTVKARALFQKMLKSLVETSHPWLTFKDAGNIRCPLDGMVHSSNLCTEIFLPTDEESTAVCNLASIVLPNHIKDGKVDYDSIAEATALAVRHLDNVIDVNFYPIPEAENANKRDRPVGVGVMGWASLLERLEIPFDSVEATKLLDKIIEFISYMAVWYSSILANERGSFPSFEKSHWAKGILPIDTLGLLNKERKHTIIHPYRTEDTVWVNLLPQIKEGMRNGTVMAIAPTATISLIANTSQSIEPNFSNVYARNNIAGKFLEVNENLVNALKKEGVWENVAEEIIFNQGDIQNIEGISENTKRIFKTAYQISPETCIAQAATAQKWVDQGISRNMYLTTRNYDELEKIYLDAWRSGLKSTYYAFVKPGMRSESTYAYDPAKARAHLNGNKQENINGIVVGFNKERLIPSEELWDESLEAQACSIDNPECESCQ